MGRTLAGTHKAVLGAGWERMMELATAGNELGIDFEVLDARKAQ